MLNVNIKEMFTSHLPPPGLWLLHVCVVCVICVQLVCACVCIDPRPGWEPCFVPAWLINGVVMAIGRNEGTRRRRSASQDPCSRPGTHTVSNTKANSRSTPCTFLTVTLVAQIRLSVPWLHHFSVSSLLPVQA